MKNLFISTLLFIGLISCDSTTSPENPLSENPAIIDFDITPSNVNFIPADGVRDTTVVVHFSGKTANTQPEQTVTLNIYDAKTGETVVSEELTLNKEQQSFEFEFNVETSTTFFNSYSANAYLNQQNTNSGIAEGQISINGFSVYPPEILDVNNPVSLELPSQGSRAVAFQAKVSDPEGLASIQGVYLRLISRTTGELSGSPFLLYDNATNGDVTPSDSVYTRAFQFNSGNQPDEYDVYYYAVDRGGLTSDTVQTTFIVTD